MLRALELAGIRRPSNLLRLPQRLPAFPRPSPGPGADGTAAMFALARLLDFQKTKYAR